MFKIPAYPEKYVQITSWNQYVEKIERYTSVLTTENEVWHGYIMWKIHFLQKTHAK